MTALSVRLLAGAHQQHTLTSEQSPLLYHAATLGFNYGDFGFVRRGLGGSVVRLLGTNLLRATAVFHILSAICLSGVACWLWARLQGNAWRKAAFALVLVALMIRWGQDAGRSDMAVASLTGMAAMLTARGRLVLAVVCLGAGLAIHETAFIFGIPLVLALLLDGERWRRIPLRQWQRALAVLAVVLAAYALIPLLPHASPSAMAAAVRERLPPSVIVDWGIYFAISGARGVQMSICQNQIDPTYWRHVLSGAAVIVLTLMALRSGSSRHLAIAAIAALAPYAFLCGVANDTSRWTYLGAFNVWLLSALAWKTSRPLERPLADCLRAGCAALLIPLVLPATLRAATVIYIPAPIVDRVAQHFGGPAMPSFVSLIDHCDPGWRSVLDGGDENAQRFPP